MNLMESVRIALRGLVANKMRAALTMLGIIIGVTAVITLLAVGQGVQAMVTESIQSMGTNLLTVRSGRLGGVGSGSAQLTYEDALAIDDPMNAPSVAEVAPVLSGNFSVTYEDSDVTTSVNGTTANYPAIRNLEIAQGRWISEEEVEGRDRVAVLGPNVAEELFGSANVPLGETIKIDRISFEVVGVTQVKGGSGMGGSEDDTVFIPVTAAMYRLVQDRTISGDYIISTAFVQAVSEEAMDAATAEIENVLRERHRIGPEEEDDFSVFNQADLVETFGEITGILTLFLGSIASISLLVGGIGIMNIMLVSVTERTREIGIRKAVGAKRRDILLQFLVESMILSLVGGAVGVLLGIAGSQAVSALSPDLRGVVTMEAILLAVGFSAAVGLFFGIYPSTRAAGLNPIDALRYE
jgi:putative ABC transport system permease protein